MGYSRILTNFDKNFSSLTLQEKPKLKKPPLYKVIMLNDDYTPMEFVVEMLQTYFSKSQEQATEIMLHIHQKGLGVCGLYTFEIAESKAAQVLDKARKNQHPLQIKLVYSVPLDLRVILVKQLEVPLVLLLMLTALTTTLEIIHGMMVVRSCIQPTHQTHQFQKLYQFLLEAPLI